MLGQGAWSEPSWHDDFCVRSTYPHDLVLCSLQVWVLVESSLYAVPLKVPRKFYVNSTLPPDDPTAAALGPRVSRTLPYGAEAHNIYQARLICCWA